jgi:polysaccharide biosynthesis protein VpsM
VPHPIGSESKRPSSHVTTTTGSRVCIILGLCFVSSALAYPQDPEQGPEQGQRPTLVQRGAFTLESSLDTEALYDSNIYQSRTDVQSSQLWNLAPSLLMQFKPARSRLEFGYKGNYGWYDKFSGDDYADHALKAAAFLLMGERGGLDLVASYDYAHENRGTGLTQGIDPASGAFPQSPDRYITRQFLARYTYGVSHTRAFVVLEASTDKLAYQNNLAFTQQFDRNDPYGRATFGVRVRSKTSVELSVQAQDFTYDHPRATGLNLDSREYRYLLGVVWEATGTTTGSVRVGGVTKKFDDPAVPSFSGPSWEVAVRWSPRTYSHFDLSTRRYTEEPIALLGAVTDTAVYSLSWSHDWNSRLESKLALSTSYWTYRFVTGDRKDRSPQYSLALTYKMRQWLRWEAGLDINARDSPVASYNYNESIARLGARITF